MFTSTLFDIKTLSAKLELTVSGYRGAKEDDDDRAKTAKGKTSRPGREDHKRKKQTMEVRKIHVKKKQEKQSDKVR